MMGGKYVVGLGSVMCSVLHCIISILLGTFLLCMEIL